MKFDRTKERQPLGHLLADLEEWQRMKIKTRLKELGFSQGQWKGLLTNAAAHKVPAFVRDVIVGELPDSAQLFNHPNLKTERVA
ncbi:hypothetical protein [Dyadobacter soli]|uniref:hypothetical protein n=1 Tax=Dyadobacter soli TaxID=659014 RepID=UPI000B7FC3C1|nr:hypothetical protein [Dyadobacter soli]